MGIGLGAFAIGRVLPHNEYIKQIAAYRDTLQNVVTTYGDSLKKISKAHDDSFAILQKNIDARGKTIATLTIKTGKIQEKNKQLDAELQEAIKNAPAVCSTVISKCQKDIEGKEQEIAINKKTINKLAADTTDKSQQIGHIRISENLQTRRADSLSTLIMNFPKPGHGKLFNIGAIEVTPTQAFFIGGGTLLVIEGVVKWVIK